MSKPKMIRIYESLFPDPIYPDDPRRKSIIWEMSEVRKAKTVQDAMEVIRWWCWDNEEELRQSVIKIRRAK